MNPIHCIHMHADGSYCQSPPQTGKSYCFSHDPEQKDKRAAAQRKGGFMRHLRSQAEPEPNSMAALNLPPLSLRTPDDVIAFIEETANLFRQGKIDQRSAHIDLSFCSVQLRAIREKRQEQKDAKREAERLAAEAAREAKLAASVDALANDSAACGATVEASGFNRVETVGASATSDAALAAGWCQGTDLSMPKGLGRKEQYRPAGGPREAQRSETKEKPIILDGSKPIDWSQFKGKKPRIAGIIPLFRNIVTGKLFDPDGLVEKELRSAGADRKSTRLNSSHRL